MKLERYGSQIELEIQEVFEIGGGGTAEETKDYEQLINKPSINGVTLIGDKSLGDLGASPLTNMEIMEIINKAES